MAEQERQTKAERREEKRLRRLEEEKAAAAAKKKARNRNIATMLALVVVLGGLGYLAIDNVRSGSEVGEDTIAFTREAAEEARLTAGCETLDVELLASREHLVPAEAGPADSYYLNGRPTASGPHYENPGPIYRGVVDEPLDERSTTHNMEHGSVVVWFDADQVDSSTVSAIDDWVIGLNDAGFEDGLGRGAGIIASAFGEPGIDSGKAVALRAWGVAMDCDSWDETVANAFVIDNYGENGTAPESFFGEFPEGVLAYVDDEADTQDGSDTTTDDEGSEDTTDDTTSDDTTDESTDEGSTDADDEASEEPES